MRNAILAGMLMTVFAGCAVTDVRDAAYNPAAHARAVADVRKHLREAVFFAIEFQDRHDEHIPPHVETKFEQRACHALKKAVDDMEHAKIGIHEVESSADSLLRMDAAAHCGLAGRINQLLP